MRRDIAYVPEGRGMFHNLTVKEHLQMAARPDSNGNTGWNFDRVMDTFPRLQEKSWTRIWKRSKPRSVSEYPDWA